jgi:hypothetical protein
MERIALLQSSLQVEKYAEQGSANLTLRQHMRHSFMQWLSRDCLDVNITRTKQYFRTRSSLHHERDMKPGKDQGFARISGRGSFLDIA